MLCVCWFIYIHVIVFVPSGSAVYLSVNEGTHFQKCVEYQWILVIKSAKQQWIEVTQYEIIVV
jgi:hypothetical protein